MHETYDVHSSLTTERNTITKTSCLFGNVDLQLTELNACEVHDSSRVQSYTASCGAGTCNIYSDDR